MSLYEIIHYNGSFDMTTSKEEAWLQGAIPGIPLLLQPVAHALVQARREVQQYLINFPEQLLWERPAGVASVGFHLQHLSGVLDRLCTYARNGSLTPAQLDCLRHEGQPSDHLEGLVQAFSDQVDQTLAQLRSTSEESLTEARGVGRKQLPSTVGGLLFHAAEHTQRHVGQLLVTVRVLQAAESGAE
uniref:DinB family protein n=1 Tax=Roseihalotalea indica TaxID=2867963 RepID=A0AA49JKI1_9BACT|nr:DinB family protein [Tunicatimonas sp. TK19036]